MTLDRNNPLFMPPGSVRGIIAILVAGIWAVTIAKTGAAPGELTTASVMILGFYFGNRSSANGGTQK
ncbi:MAG: hypothetical protein ABIH23_05940 [bacterium]